MKSISNRFFLSIYLFAFLAILTPQNSSSQSPENNKLDAFLLLVEATPDGNIKVTCKKGCGFIWISYEPRKNSPQGIDQRGMSPDISEMKTSEDSFATFYFTVTLKDEGLYLEGLEGTSWSELTINCPEGNCYQYIDQNGLVEKEDK